MRVASPRASASSASGCWARTNTAATRKETVAEAMMESSTPIREAFGVISSTAKMEPGEAGETRPALNRVRVKTPVMPPAITARMRRGFIST
ncbi:hypothetical protein D3C84_1181240 [compost metagenome]